MKKTAFTLLCISMLVLTACQPVGTQLPRDAADKTSDEKAQSASRVNIVVKEDALSPVPSPDSDSDGTVSAEAPLKEINITIGENGLSPDKIEINKGAILTITNTLDKQIELFTDTDGDKPCPVFGPTIEIAGLKFQKYELERALSCSIINQENTSQKTTITVK
jgi:hypothetical protein